MKKPRWKNISGKVYGKLTVLSYDHTDAKGQAVWYCACSCGKKTYVRTKELNYGNTRSCGCLISKHDTRMGKKRKINWIPEPVTVSLHKKTGKWIAYINANKKHVHLGYFAEIGDAIKCRKDAARIYHGEFNNG
jgi:hypothetical protein